MGYKLPTQCTSLTGDISIWLHECETLQVGIQMLELKKSVVAIIFFDMLEEDGRSQSR